MRRLTASEQIILKNAIDGTMPVAVTNVKPKIFSVRKFSKNDAPAVETIIRRSFYSDSANLLFWLKVRLLGKKNTETLVSTNSDDIPIGCLNFSMCKSLIGTPYLKVNFLAVSPEKRRTGVASQLIFEFLDYMRANGVSRAYFASNDSLSGMYLKMLIESGAAIVPRYGFFYESYRFDLSR